MIVSVPVLAPAYTPPLVTLLQVLPLLILTCQLWVGDVPVTAAVKLATLSVHTAASVGWVVIASGWLTVTITVLAGDVQEDTLAVKPTLPIKPRGVKVGAAGMFTPP